MVAIIDYGAGNLFSVKNALDYIGVQTAVTADRHIIEKADALILPGVGAFPDAMRMLTETDLPDFLKEQAQKKPFLGICVGMQLLFQKGYEFQETDGLGLIPGTVIKITEKKGYKIPHMGWNDLKMQNLCPMLSGIDTGAYVYFVHSFRAETPVENIAAYTEYTETIPALVQRGNVFGTQFHPEKSGEVGLIMLRNFAKLA